MRQLNMTPRNNWGQKVIRFINGYSIIKGVHNNPTKTVSVLNCSKTNNPIVKSTNKKIIAEDFLSFLNTKEIQEIISRNNIMYPIIESATPPKMKNLPKPSEAVNTSTGENLISLWLNATTQ